MSTNNDLLGQRLLQLGHVTEDDLDNALQMQKTLPGRLGALLIRIGALSEDHLLTALSEQLGWPVLKDADLPESSELFRGMMRLEINFEWFLSEGVALWESSGTTCCIARDPLSPALSETLRQLLPDRKITFALVASESLDRLLGDIEREFSVDTMLEHSDDAIQLRELAEEAPVIEFVNNVMARAVDAGASDIHIEPEEREFNIRFRIDGVMQHRMSQPLERYAAVASRIKLVSGLDIAERRLPQDGRMSTRISGVDLDVRVSSVPCIHGESLVMRLLPKHRDELSMSGLGMESDHLQQMQSWVSSSGGIVLVTGPTGSGKSTTLHAALTDTNDGIRKIVTVEDPVEFQLKGITQIQAHAEIGYTFARALRAILRQDPDVIMIGEIRDLETAEIAIQSALSGHLVLSTLHTNDAISSFTRLIDMGVEPFLVAAPLKGVQAQRLVRKLCPHCNEPAEPSPEVLAQMQGFQGRSGMRWRKAVGCVECQYTGYSGRLGIYQLVEIDQKLQDMIVTSATLNDMRRYAAEKGGRTLLQDGLIKASHGVTSLDEVYRVITAEEVV